MAFEKCYARVTTLAGQLLDKDGIVSSKVTHGCMGSALCIGNSFSHIVEITAVENAIYVEGACVIFEIIESGTEKKLYRHPVMIDSVVLNAGIMTVTCYGVFCIPVMENLFNWEWCPSCVKGNIPTFGEVLSAIRDNVGIDFTDAQGNDLCVKWASISLPYRNCSTNYENDGSKYTIRQMIEYIAGAFACNASEGWPGTVGRSKIVIDNFLNATGSMTTSVDYEVLQDGNSGTFSNGPEKTKHFTRLEVTTTSADTVNRSSDLIKTRTIEIGASAGSSAYTLQMDNPFINTKIASTIMDEISGRTKKFFTYTAAIRYVGNKWVDDFGVISSHDKNGNTIYGPAMQIVTTCDGGLLHEVTLTGPDARQPVASSGSSNVEATGTANQVYIQVNNAIRDVATLKVTALTVDNIDAKVAEIDHAFISEAQIKDASISSAKIKDLAITSAKIKDAAITTAKIENSAITTAKIENAAITTEKVAESAITNAQIKNASISYAKIDNAFVDNLKTKALNASYADIALANVTVENVGQLFAKVGLIDRATIVDGHVTGFLDAVEVNANKITAGTLTANRILLASDKGLLYELNNLGELVSQNTDTLDANVLTDRTITADKVVAGSITANEIDVASIFAQSITATGTITGGSFIGGTYTGSVFNGATGNFSGEITAEGGRIGRLWIDSSGDLYAGERKYGMVQLKPSVKEITIENYTSTGAGNESISSYNKLQLTNKTVYSSNVINRYRASVTPSQLRMTDYGITGTSNKYTDVKGSGITTPTLTVNGTTFESLRTSAVKVYTLSLGDVQINTSAPFSTNVSTIMSNLEANLVGVGIKMCWPRTTWQYSCTAQCNGLNVYVSTTTSQVYELTLLLYYTEK